MPMQGFPTSRLDDDGARVANVGGLGRGLSLMRVGEANEKALHPLSDL